MLLEIGRITRAHGLDGEVVVMLTTNRRERVNAGSVLFTSDRRLLVTKSRPHKSAWIVSFADVTDREFAEQLSGALLHAEPLEDNGVLWAHEMIGAMLVDQQGIERGTVVRMIENPASDLLELDNGALVPARFIVDVSPTKRISADVPLGLFELDNASMARETRHLNAAKLRR